MRALDLKLFRDLKRLWAQALAIALVVAGGFATIILAVGSYRSLEETRVAYYERYQFADVFATVRRAPTTLVGRIAEIPGVIDVEVRIESSRCSTYRTSVSRPPADSSRYPGPGNLTSIGSTSASAACRSRAELTRSSSTRASQWPTASHPDRASRRS